VYNIVRADLVMSDVELSTCERVTAHVFPSTTTTTMEWWLGLWKIVVAVISLVLDVAQFWRDKLLSWWASKSPRARLAHVLATAQTYEEWEEAAFELDELLSKDLW
jgi:hypothetical protein